MDQIDYTEQEIEYVLAMDDVMVKPNFNEIEKKTNY